MQVDVPRALALEAEIQHDLMAELKAFAEQAPLGGAILHLGATSMDIEDNADVLRLRQALDLILAALRGLLRDFAGQIETFGRDPADRLHPPAARRAVHAGLPPGELRPGSAGWIGKLASGAQGFRGKGFKGAVGSGPPTPS